MSRCQTEPRCCWRTGHRRSCFRYGRVRASNGGMYCAQHWRMIQALLGLKR
jgi:hypothetical protein